MKFTTRIPIQNSDHPIDYKSRVVSLGSCFAVNIGEKFDHFKFRNTTNPFGILFHPLALANFIAFAVNQKVFTEADIFFHNERWHCFDAHSDLSHPDKESLLGNLNNAVASANAAIKSATHLIITLGTAWIYRHKPTGGYVANCHKFPQKEFNKELVHIIEVEVILTSIIKLLNRLNPELQVIFTVSPVRHIKDGFTENQWSKANLIAGVHEILDPKHGNTNCTYFPSYEIMMDELRDYRFYGPDMLHPNSVAIDYIWERFTEAFITEGTQKTMEKVDNIQKGIQHRPFNPASAQHLDFLSKLDAKKAALQMQYPHISF